MTKQEIIERCEAIEKRRFILDMIDHQTPAEDMEDRRLQKEYWNLQFKLKEMEEKGA